MGDFHSNVELLEKTWYNILTNMVAQWDITANNLVSSKSPVRADWWAMVALLVFGTHITIS